MWHELIPGTNGKPINDVYDKQYELVYGSWPARYDEVVIFVDKNNEIDDLTLYALGLESWDEIKKIAEAGATHDNNLTYYCAYILYSDFIAILIRVVYYLAIFTGGRRK